MVNRTLNREETRSVKPVDPFLDILSNAAKDAVLGNSEGTHDLCLGTRTLATELRGEHTKGWTIALLMLKADLLSLVTVHVQDQPIELPPSLREFQKRMAAQNAPLSEADLSDLASTKFRGGQPQSVDEWHQLYLLLSSSVRRRES